MLEPSVAGCCLTGTDVDRWMAVLAEKRDLRRLLNEMYPFGCGRVVPDDDNMEEMAESAGRLLALWHWAEGFFSKEELERFFPLWMENHAMVFLPFPILPGRHGGTRDLTLPFSIMSHFRSRCSAFMRNWLSMQLPEGKRRF